MAEEAKKSSKKEDDEGTLAQNIIIFGGALLLAGVIMFASLYQVTHKTVPKTEVVTYNGFDFEHIEGMWYTKWQKNGNVYSIPLRYNPYQVENVSILGALNSSFNRPKMYVAFDPTKGNFSIMALAAGELSLSLVRAIGVTPEAACLINDTTVCEGRPIVPCPMPNSTVIILDNEGDPSIWLKGDCIELRGSHFDILKSTDRLLYSWYGIIK